MYESHIVCQFFREWGFRDGLTAAKDGPDSHKPISILGNMQNKFDAFFGDVAISDQFQFKLIEFKREIAGFGKEVSTSKKNSRGPLYRSLCRDEECLNLSYKGHAGAYEYNNVLRIDPYHPLVAGVTVKESKGQVYESLYNDFDSYYQRWNANAENEECEVGLNASDFYKYVACMYGHLDEQSTGYILIRHKKRQVTLPFEGYIKGMIRDLAAVIPELASLLPKTPQDGNIAETSRRVNASKKIVEDEIKKASKPDGTGR